MLLPPWARASERIAREEVGHMGFGLWAVKRAIEFGGSQAWERLQRRVPKFLAMGMGMYGRPSWQGKRSLPISSATTTWV